MSNPSKRSSSSSLSNSNKFNDYIKTCETENHSFSNILCSTNNDSIPDSEPVPAVASPQRQEGGALLSDDTFVYDEIHDECIYLVTIRKVYNKNLQPKPNVADDSKNKPNPYGTYRPISTNFQFYLSESSNETNNNNNNTASNQNDGLIYSKVKSKQLKFATLSKLIEHLTNAETGELDSSLVQIFLTTYRTFTDTNTALRALFNRYEQIHPASLEMTQEIRLEHLKSFRSIFYMWLEKYTEDFNEPPDYPNLVDFYRFIRKYQIDTEFLKKIKSKLEHFESINSLVTSQTENSAANNIATNNSNKNKEKPPPHKTMHRRSFSNLAAPTTPGTPNFNLSRSQNNIFRLNGNPSAVYDILPNNSTIVNRKISAISNPGVDINGFTFMSFDSSYFAEQLTYIDKCLFPKVNAHLCLGGVWSTRYQKNGKNNNSNNNSELNRRSSNGGMSSPTTALLTSSTNSSPVLSDKFASIGAFIDQFNRVSFFVQATVLENSDLMPNERVKIIKKWIEVAQECRAFKNFSSLNAIVQGLNTQCVSRLEKTWNELPL